PSTDDADEKPTAGDAGGKPAATAGDWSALWRDIRSGTGQAEEAERLAWQTPCLSLLGDAASSLASAAISSLANSTTRGGWALVPCASSSNLVCELASGAATEDGGKVAWLHLAEDEQAPATGVAVTDSLLLTSDANRELSYASVSARSLGGAEVEVVSEAHRVLPGGVLSGYDLSVAPPNNALLENGKSLDGEPDRGRPKNVDEVAVFVDHSTAPVDVVGQRWRGDVAVVGLPGGGLHRHVRYSFGRASTIVLSPPWPRSFVGDHDTRYRCWKGLQGKRRADWRCLGIWWRRTPFLFYLFQRRKSISPPLCEDLPIMFAGGFHKQGSHGNCHFL
ncbi:unnamed protein product, partial [Ectocarpus sp. 12 AP-2014]